MEITAADKRRWGKLIRDRLRNKYGRGKGCDYAWDHLSESARKAIWTQEAAFLVLAQDSSTAEKLTFKQAQEMLQVGMECAEEEEV